MPLLIHDTEYGRRTKMVDDEYVQNLVKNGEAKQINQLVFQRLAPAQYATKVMTAAPADAEEPEETNDSDPERPRRRGRPRKDAAQ